MLYYHFITNITLIEHPLASDILHIQTATSKSGMSNWLPISVLLMVTFRRSCYRVPIKRRNTGSGSRPCCCRCCCYRNQHNTEKATCVLTLEQHKMLLLGIFFSPSESLVRVPCNHIIAHREADTNTYTLQTLLSQNLAELGRMLYVAEEITG